VKEAVQSPRGFTLIELMIVIAIIAIMATYALPSYQDRVIRAQVSEGLGLAEFARHSVQMYYSKHRRMPKDNAAAGLPPADRIIGNYVTGLAVADGAIIMTFGNRSNRNIAGRKLTLRPAVVDGYPAVPLSWVCGIAAGPEKMRLLGQNQTDLPAPLLPIDCR
jgi:type IV pilus assembly protein PilA